MFLFPLVFQFHTYRFILFHSWCLRRDCTLMLSPVHSENWDGCFLLLLLNYLFIPLSLLSPCPDNCRHFPLCLLSLSHFLLLFSISCIKWSLQLEDKWITHASFCCLVHFTAFTVLRLEFVLKCAVWIILFFSSVFVILYSVGLYWTGKVQVCAVIFLQPACQ